MTDQIVDEIKDAVDSATSEENFDALDFFSNSALPTGTVTLHGDTAAAVRLVEIRTAEQAREILEQEEGLGLTDEIEYTDEDEVNELTQRLNDSAVTFSLKGIAPAARNALEKATRAKQPYVEGAENPEYWEAFNANLIAKSIVSVTNAKGQKDKNPWDAARVTKFADVTEPSEWQKLFRKVYDLNFIADAIDRAVTADF